VRKFRVRISPETTAKAFIENNFSPIALALASSAMCAAFCLFFFFFHPACLAPRSGTNISFRLPHTPEPYSYINFSNHRRFPSPSVVGLALNGSRARSMESKNKQALNEEQLEEAKARSFSRVCLSRKYPLITSSSTAFPSNNKQFLPRNEEKKRKIRGDSNGVTRFVEVLHVFSALWDDFVGSSVECVRNL
jgi:hypothetical protein